MTHFNLIKLTLIFLHFMKISYLIILTNKQTNGSYLNNNINATATTTRQ